MIVQYFRGPLDGGVDQIPDNTRLWVVSMPRSVARDVFTPEDENTPIMSAAVVDEHAYAITDKHSQAGARIFEYVGERVRK